VDLLEQFGYEEDQSLGIQLILRKSSKKELLLIDSFILDERKMASTFKKVKEPPKDNLPEIILKQQSAKNLIIGSCYSFSC
jgi:hypothetical protein